MPRTRSGAAASGRRGDDEAGPASPPPGPAVATRSRTASALLAARTAGGPAPAPSSLPQDQLALLRARGLGAHGCKHYRRRCLLVAPCCGEAFWCRHCHNEVKAANEWDPMKRHELERTAVKEVVCALCEVRQPAAPACNTCGVAFGVYICMRCCFFEDDVRKKQFHCDRCGICRVGGADNFFHCDTCGCCYSKSLEDNHVCVENSMRQNCPVCFEYLFDSVRPTAVLPCGHTIHSDCLKEMEKNRQLACPICMKSYADLAPVWRRVDEEIAATPMPAEYSSWAAQILCNDCHAAGRVAFHILGLKCPSCASYNTRRLGIDRGEGEGGSGGEAAAVGGGGGGGGPGA